MARIRTIKPEFFLHDGLAELSPLHRLLFIGLWTQADRAGRMDDRPKRLKAAILPYDNAPIEKLLNDLQAAGFILRYTVGGERYLCIPGFAKHQNPHIREVESSLPEPCFQHEVPEPCEHSASTVPEQFQPVGREGKGREGNGSGKGTDQGREGDSAQAMLARPARGKPAAEKPTAETWTAYAAGYRERYGIDPTRNAKVNGQLAQLVGRLGGEEAPQVAGWYPKHNGALYVRARHCTDLLLRDAEALRTEWATGRQVTHGDAALADRTQTTANVWGPLLDEAREAERLAALEVRHEH